MKLERLWCNVRAEVSFTKEEADFLIERAQRHYDSACQAAGMSYEDGAFENGFIKQLRLFPDHNPVWTSRQLDLALKVLEPFTNSHYADEMRGRLFEELKAAFDALQTKYKELNGV